MEIKTYKTGASYSKAIETDLHTAEANSHAKAIAKQTTDKSIQPVIANQKVYFAIDKNDDVIIRIIDSKTGKVVKQIPPEEYLEMSKVLKETTGKLFHVEV